MTEPLIFEMGAPGRRATTLPPLDVPESQLPKAHLRRSLTLPEVSQVELIRHFNHLSKLNYGVDTGFYPLGSCTMKYNPKINEDAANLPGFSRIHPYQDEETVQGALELMSELQTYLGNIAGFDAVTLQPAAGAHGEFTGVLVIRAYHVARGDTARTKVIVPDSAHGTNPATAAMCGYDVVTVRSDARGNVDLGQLRELVGPDTAALMLTNPNTLGLFDEHLREVLDTVHGAGGLVYGDGANLNAILGVARPGDLGFDVLHFNVHKTFSTPHGGGGPGSGPVGVKAFLAEYLPGPVVSKKEDGAYTLAVPARSVGKVRAFYGSFGILVRAYAYIMSLGPEGLRSVGENAVLAANYLMHRLKDAYFLPIDRSCMHEFVLSGAPQKKEKGVKTLDLAKRLLDYGYHAPTIYFPLIVEESIMIEPTETESVEVLDAFVDTMLKIADEIQNEPEVVKSAPHNTPVRRLDEVRAARQPDLRWTPPDN